MYKEKERSKILGEHKLACTELALQLTVSIFLSVEVLQHIHRWHQLVILLNFSSNRERNTKRAVSSSEVLAWNPFSEVGLVDHLARRVQIKNTYDL